MPSFLAGIMPEIMNLLMNIFTKPLTIALMIALQVVRTSFGFHLRECMGFITFQIINIKMKFVGLCMRNGYKCSKKTTTTKKHEKLAPNQSKVQG